MELFTTQAAQRDAAQVSDTTKDAWKIDAGDQNHHFEQLFQKSIIAMKEDKRIRTTIKHVLSVRYFRKCSINYSLFFQFETFLYEIVLIMFNHFF